MELVFWLLALLSVFSYFVYPLIIKTLVLAYPSAKSADKNSELPPLTLIITAHNEAHRIGEKLDNTMLLEYPQEKLTIIVASDNSTDETDSIVGSFAERGVQLVRATERLGKENAQLQAIKTVDEGIIVFSDVATKIEPDGLTKLARYFDDSDIGAISSEDRFISKEGKVAGEGAYVKYEMWLRKQESQLAGLVGLSGSFFAARHEVCQKWDIHSPSDFNTALNSASLGLKAVTAPDVLGYYTDLADPTKEYNRKIRTVIRGMTALKRHPEVLNPFKYGWFAFQVVSHKLLRWTVPWSLLALFIITPFCMQTGHTVYTLAFVAQIAFYGTALLAHWLPKLQDIGVIKIVYFFTQVNIALFEAGIKFLSGKRMTVWQPSAR